MVYVTYNIPDTGVLALFLTIPLSASRLSVLLVVLALSFIFPLIFRRNLVDKDGYPIPPGPLLRYAFLRRYPERALRSWARTYGPLFSVWMGNQLFVVVSDARIAKDLLVTNGAIFSSRKLYFMKNQTILRGRAITATPYNDTWQMTWSWQATTSQDAMQLLTPKAIQGYASVLDYEAHILVRSLYHESHMGTLPIDPAHFAGRYALNNMLTITFATRTDSTLDPLTERALALATEFMELTGPWSNIVDFIEPLQRIPTPTRTRGRLLHDGIVEVYGAMIMRVRARMDAGEDVPDCLVKTLLLTQEQEKLDWEDLCMLSAVFTLGGVHSTSGVIQWFLALISSHPDVQARAHAELDQVIGRDYWPTAQDEMRLPYIRAIIKEVERAHSPFWMATPHYSTEDFVYNGMYIPKNTALVLNCYDIHHNEEKYTNSYEVFPFDRIFSILRRSFAFNPDRYLGDTLTCAESSKLSDAMDRDHWAFGAGRRICPGVHVAERELWLAISRLLWAYDIRSLPDEPISLEEYEGESGRTPLPYRIMLIPRHDRVQALLEAEQEVTLMKL
ncbi:cytochrome P450 [Multifurca ochricompacta]|uniref:Cytochrome P450 n=1 Tax=Multifurca ochricompacta TaxID=376703 RepID=A0AAD4M7H7_9AGAM|nr:cytochrome P450 [Multifurca ochricompacta]